VADVVEDEQARHAGIVADTTNPDVPRTVNNPIRLGFATRASRRAVRGKFCEIKPPRVQDSYSSPIIWGRWPDRAGGDRTRSVDNVTSSP